MVRSNTKSSLVVMVEGSVKKISFPKYRLAQKKRKVLLRFVPGISEKKIDRVKFPTLFFCAVRLCLPAEGRNCGFV